ncbi:MAG TPA: glycine zipper 2TM domain-containing protein [Ottowia sp.]|uniref:glycine zipper 2TM domain-containing protein n=1 Tax=Ottowia sp. TaxID=1898956 RepID=UPI002C23F9E3|nr:glycine zipper 2TM domain-containing protein [Ottowia sp.]HMN21737.1 glycine zipper 2TM domain-containing protein [Ottowia sp.]
MSHTRIRSFTIVAAIVSAMTLSACAGMSRETRHTATGAAVGAVAGSVLTHGSAVGTLGGAAIGGLIGNESGKKGK